MEESLPGCFFHPLCSLHWGLQEENSSAQSESEQNSQGARFSNPGSWAPPHPSLPTHVHAHSHTHTHTHTLSHTHCTYFPASFSRCPVLCEMTPFLSTLAGLGWSPECAPWASRTCSGKRKESDCLGIQWEAHSSPVWPCSLLVGESGNLNQGPRLGGDTSKQHCPSRCNRLC